MSSLDRRKITRTNALISLDEGTEALVVSYLVRESPLSKVDRRTLPRTSTYAGGLGRTLRFTISFPVVAVFSLLGNRRRPNRSSRLSRDIGIASRLL